MFKDSMIVASGVPSIFVSRQVRVPPSEEVLGEWHVPGLQSRTDMLQELDGFNDDITD